MRTWKQREIYNGGISVQIYRINCDMSIKLLQTENGLSNVVRLLHARNSIGLYTCQQKRRRNISNGQHLNNYRYEI